MKVLISDSMSDKAREVFEKTPGIECDVQTGLSPDELREKIKEYHGLVVRSATKVTAHILEAAENLKVIGRAGTGVDNIDVPAATKKGVVVMNTPGGNTVTTAEHAVAMMVSLARNIPQATATMREGRWEKKRFQGTELTGKTLGILGIGNIGAVVASRAQGLKMNVIAYDPFISEEAADKLGVRLVSLDECLAGSDFLSIHVPLTPDTRNIINADAFKKMKRGIRLINCARGGIVNEADLLEAIESGIVAGAALDVFETEPPPPDNPLLKHEKVILTPHLGASTREAQEKVAVAVAEQMADYLTTGTIRNAVNVPSVPGELLDVLGPYIDLGEKLGSLLGQTITSGIEEIVIEYTGEVLDHDVSPITMASIKGILDRLMDQYVNFVNARFVAEERGIKVVEVKSSRSIDFVSSVTIKVKTSDGAESVVEGSLFGRREPRIVRLDKFFIDAVPEGYLLILHNEDKPGVIGNVGTLLGANNVNIARLHLGREAVGGEAVSVWNIDTPLSRGLIDKLLKLPHIISARLVEL
ncbi:MAG TPA: phosphoglycerate dehydrogenase [Deltaproteobacteria bacterium]|nr:phosphoglycerate dehydrogenase [Deltaproteobacteria bacterium]